MCLLGFPTESLPQHLDTQVRTSYIYFLHPSVSINHVCSINTSDNMQLISQFVSVSRFFSFVRPNIFNGGGLDSRCII